MLRTRSLCVLATVAMSFAALLVFLPATPASASPSDNCWGTAYAPWKSGVTIHFAVSSFCYPNRIDRHRIVVEVYRNGRLQRYKRVSCYGTDYCHAEITFNDGPFNQTWCTVIEGTFYSLGYGGRVLPGQKSCESESW